MEEGTKRELEEYREYLERLAESNSPDMFSNGGIQHASILMSVLFKKTRKNARMYSNGFKSRLITTQPYWDELNFYLNNPKNELTVLVECADFIEEEPLMRLQEAIRQRNYDNTIQVKLISSEGKKMIADRFGKGHCNFAIFDDDKFRFEYDPENFKAFGSFYQPEKCEILTNLFDEAFASSRELWMN